MKDCSSPQASVITSSATVGYTFFLGDFDSFKPSDEGGYVFGAKTSSALGA